MNIEHYKAASEATDADERALIPPFRHTTTPKLPALQYADIQTQTERSNGLRERLQRQGITTMKTPTETKQGKQHTWGRDGFCVYCDNVHQTDGNARSTCSDGFTCTAARTETGSPRRVSDKAQHSPFPWRTVVETDFEPCSIYADPEQHVADIYGNDKRQRAANARLIVASVNHADKLAEALRDILEAAKDPESIAEVKALGFEALDGRLCLEKFAGRVQSVAKAAIAAYETAQ